MRHASRFALIAVVGILTSASGSTVRAEQRGLLSEPAAMKGIEAARTAFADAYMRQDAAALSSVYHPDAIFAGTLHPYWMEGQDAIQRLWTYYFATYKNARIVFWSSSFRALAPNVVAQAATATMAMPMSPPDPSGHVRIHNIHMRLSIIWIQVPQYTVGAHKLEWQIAHMHGSEAPLFR